MQINKTELKMEDQVRIFNIGLRHGNYSLMSVKNELIKSILLYYYSSSFFENDVLFSPDA